MDISRRELAGLGGALVGLSVSGLSAQARAGLTRDQDTPGRQPWYQRVKRICQINITERDSREVDAEALAQYMADAKVQVAMLSITGVVAFYPTKVANLRQALFLNGRDLVGECVRALRGRGIRVVGRMSPDVISLEVDKVHPEWFRKSTPGPRPAVRPDLPGSASDRSDLNASDKIGFGPSCQFTSYFTEQIPRIMRECLSLYDLDGIYMNGWPNSYIPPCYCAECVKIGDPTSAAYKRAYAERAVKLWDMFSDIVREGRPDRFFTGNITGGLEGGDIDYGELAGKAAWFTADNQGRKTDGPAWDAAQQVRIGRAVVGDRNVVQVTAAAALNIMSRWRHTTGNPAEVTSRMIQTAAAGGAIWFAEIGYLEGWNFDRRWMKIGSDFLSWHAANDAHFHNRHSLASVAVIASPRSTRAYKPPVGMERLDAVEGTYSILTEARIPFDLLHEDYITAETLKPYRVILLPNFARMSDAQAKVIEAFARGGGSVVATFETGAYDDAGKLRDQPALAELFGIRRTGPRAGEVGPTGERPRMYAVDRRNQITAAFADTKWISGGNWHVPIATTDSTSALSLVPPVSAYPVEAMYSPALHSDEPALAFRETGNSRHVFIPGNVDSAYWRYGLSDLAELLVGSVRWACGGDLPVMVDGDGLVDLFAYRTEPGYAVHLVNYTSPHLFRGAFREVHRLGPQKVRLVLEDARPVGQVKLLRSGRTIPFTQDGRQVSFVIPGLGDYEVAAVIV